MGTKLRKKRIWTVSDFAKHAEISHRAARRILKAINAKHGGQLLIPSQGENKKFTFLLSVMQRLEPNRFPAPASLEFRLEELETALALMKATFPKIAKRTADNTRYVAQLGELTRSASSARPAALRRVG